MKTSASFAFSPCFRSEQQQQHLIPKKEREDVPLNCITMLLAGFWVIWPAFLLVPFFPFPFLCGSLPQDIPREDGVGKRNFKDQWMDGAGWSFGGHVLCCCLRNFTLHANSYMIDVFGVLAAAGNGIE